MLEFIYSFCIMSLATSAIRYILYDYLYNGVWYFYLIYMICSHFLSEKFGQKIVNCLSLLQNILYNCKYVGSLLYEAFANSNNFTI